MAIVLNANSIIMLLALLDRAIHYSTSQDLQIRGGIIKVSPLFLLINQKIITRKTYISHIYT